MTTWRIGVFRPLLHIPTDFVTPLRGARLAAGLCGSFVYVDRAVAPDLNLDACQTCVERAPRCPSTNRPTTSDDWPGEPRSTSSS